MTLPKTTRQLLKITYPNGAVAFAPVFLDGSYYGKDEVDAGRAVAEPVFDGYPLDRYYEWAAHTPSEVLQKIEATFADLERILEDRAAVRRVVGLISTSEVFTHYQRWSGVA